MAKKKTSKRPKSAATIGKRRLQERAIGCSLRIMDLIKDIPFEKLATAVYLFCADIKTLSTILGHVSAATTLDIYTHITSDMQRMAAANIDRGIGKAEPAQESASPQPEQPKIIDFKPYKGRMRKPGTGCVSQISEHCWEGRYSPVWPDGKKHSRNVYAKTREECEALLADLIVEMKAEIQAAKEGGDMGAIPDGVSKKRKQIAAYMRKHPEVTNKSLIAREVQVDRNTVVRYYDQIRNEMRK